MSIDPIEDIMDDPDKRAKLFLILSGASIVVTIMIVIGTLIFILRVLGLF
ncbi:MULTISPECIES: hypothetical protein [Methanobacterium]|jgi:hypothetical protein|uniref:Uncharacterized protein n=1 Tax=Methanobacterium veterum TaxID=408577 RepID=A0A9E5DHZ8_9EURY|nr:MULTISPECIES: hypothetical protein [Methanobacterium]MCZ3366326.1 hypothetical protein [Methanobacterium veterum]MCZ3371834.1 hypothetical protein [Methanobacterium veterum]